MHGSEGFDFATFGLRIVTTLFFVVANGFFVAAEFSLVKIRGAELASLASSGDARARLAKHIHGHLNLYLSACQLGITLASLILGWLAEPAVAELLLAGMEWAGWERPGDSAVLHGIALAIALTVITILHMTIGEQAPKIWAIQKPQGTALWVARPLTAFAAVFRPFIWLINELSNWLLRLAGLPADEHGEGTASLEEIKSILAASAEEGQISHRQQELAQNVFGLISLEVRHIMVPRVDATFLSLQNAIDHNLKVVRESGHSRFPLCEIDLESVIGIVHAKDIMNELVDGRVADLRKLSREALVVSDTQPISSLILRMQRKRSHCAVVLDEHGTAVGLAFLEDALEEIVGPLGDEFDEDESYIRRRSNGMIEVDGDVAFPEAARELMLLDVDGASDTIGGFVVSMLGRLPRRGDRVEVGQYQVEVVSVVRNRVATLLFRPDSAEEDESALPEMTPDASK